MRYSIAAGCAAVLLIVTACSSSSNGSGSSSPAASPPTSSSPASSPAASSAGQPAASAPLITIKNFGFSGTLTVKPGAKVTVVNQDSVAHTLTDKKTHKFDTGNIPGGGGKGTFTAPTTPGSYPFGCTYHPDMAGTLVVKG